MAPLFAVSTIVRRQKRTEKPAAEARLKIEKSWRVVVFWYTKQPEEVVVDDQKAPKSEQGVVYEVRALTNRWVEPQKGPVISTHTSAKAAWAAFQNEPQAGTDGSGRTSTGNYVAKAVVRVDSEGGETMVLPPPAGGGLLSWPYT